MHKALWIAFTAFATACGTEPHSLDPAVGTYQIASVNQSRMTPPFTVHIEGSRTGFRNRLEVLTDTLDIRADGAWEERTNWRYTDYEAGSAVSLLFSSSAGTFARDAEGHLLLTGAATAQASAGFLATVGLPAVATVTADTLFIPGDLSSVAWQPRYTRVP